MAQLILWLCLAMGLAGVVESRSRTCYFGRPPKPLPMEHWRQAAAREIRKRCPGTQSSHVENDNAEAEVEAEVSSTPAGPRPADCQENRNMGGPYGGRVTIYPAKYPHGLEVSCNGDWIVIHRRNVESDNFTRSWAEYRDGFGNLDYSFWLGNEKVRQLTSVGGWQLQVGLSYGDQGGGNINFDEFLIVGDEYQLVVSGPEEYAVVGDSLTGVHANQNFSTYDRDNDADDNANCAAELMGGWWFKTCTGGVDDEDLVPTNLNGEYSYPVNYTEQDYRGIRWAGVGQIRACELRIRRIN